MKKNAWAKAGSDYFLREISINVDNLSAAIYNIAQTPLGELFLQQADSHFEFPYKVYGMQKQFIDQVIGTWQATNRNLGILLNGKKGTGKTVCAKQICNGLLDLRLPVIIVTSFYEQLPQLINNIQQDVVLFFDEYEKVYHEKDHSILTVMDGVLDNGFRRAFLLTTNEKYVSSYMLDRPGRIRYLKNFDDMDQPTIEEIVDDILQIKSRRKEVIDYISKLETITVDIVKAVVEEVNIHDVDPEVFHDYFNVSKINKKANIVYIEDDTKESIIIRNADVSLLNFSVEDTDDDFYVNGFYKGHIIKVIDKQTIILETPPNRTGERQKVKWRIEPTDGYHQSFTGSSRH